MAEFLVIAGLAGVQYVANTDWVRKPLASFQEQISSYLEKRTNDLQLVTLTGLTSSGEEAMATETPPASGDALQHPLMLWMDSYQFQEDSWINKFFLFLAPSSFKERPATLKDVVLVTLSTAAIPVMYFAGGTSPITIFLAVPTLAVGTSSFYTRGAAVAFLPPLVVYQTVRNPKGALLLLGEAFRTFAYAAKKALDLGFQVTGLLVTTSGVVVGLLLSRSSNFHKVKES
jgi:hypothetical protein